MEQGRLVLVTLPIHETHLVGWERFFVLLILGQITDTTCSFLVSLIYFSYQRKIINLGDVTRSINKTIVIIQYHLFLRGSISNLNKPFIFRVISSLSETIGNLTGNFRLF